MRWLRLFLPFAAAYFLSYHFRTVNTVIGPILAEELSLGAADLGLLTSAYFIAFGAAQLPLGLALDRFGARKVEAVLLLIAGTGAVVFSFGHSIGVLAIGRAMIGFGVSACLMGALKFFTAQFPPERLPSLTGWIMTAGSLGALVASAPLDAALQIAPWRSVFALLGAITFAAAGALFVCVPDTPAKGRPESFSVQLAGLRQVLKSRYFWRFAPVGLAQIGGFMAVQSLWSSAWLIHVNGYSRSVAAEHIAAMSIAMTVSYLLIGLLATWLARHGIGTAKLLGGGMALGLCTLLLIVTQATDRHLLLWTAYGLFSSFGTLTYAATSAGFPAALTGRANTLVNLAAFIGAFVLQWGIGLLVDLSLAQGNSPDLAYRNAFIVLFVVQTSALIWLVVGGRRTADVVRQEA